jgi:hypothetical protein
VASRRQGIKRAISSRHALRTDKAEEESDRADTKYDLGHELDSMGNEHVRDA